MSSFFGDASFFVIKLCLRQQMDLIATNHCFPIKSVVFIEHFFSRFRPSVHLCRCAKQRIDLFDVSILTRFLVGDDNGGMAPLLAERKHDHVPLVHCAAYSRSFGTRTTEALASRFSSMISALP